jgi:hypothetical protein
MGTRIKGREGTAEYVENVRGLERENAISNQTTFKGACSRREARQARVAAMEHRVNVEFNNHTKFIFNWLQKRIKRSCFCRNYKNAGNDICQKKIAGLKILIQKYEETD